MPSENWLRSNQTGRMNAPIRLVRFTSFIVQMGFIPHIFAAVGIFYPAVKSCIAVNIKRTFAIKLGNKPYRSRPLLPSSS